jgi:hypothetical protein
VILILLGAAGSALIALNSGNRSDYVAISANLGPGHKLEPKDLSRGDLAGATGALIPWSEASKYIGRYTTTSLYKDQFVTPQNFSKDTNNPIPAGGALVGVTLEAGRAPADGIDVGDIVRIVKVPTSSDTGGAAVSLVTAAEVTSSSGAIAGDKTNATPTLNVTVLVPVEKSTNVAAAAASKTLALVKLAVNTKPEISRTAGAN